jgi:hypothetical protein
MKKTLRVSVLVMLLACSVYAGDMPNGLTSAPPPPSAASAVQESVEESQKLQIESTAAKIMLDLLQSILALF